MRKSSCQNKLPESDIKERYEGMSLKVGRPVFEGVYMKVGKNWPWVFEEDTAGEVEWIHLGK